jgi:hypothetical protein
MKFISACGLLLALGACTSTQAPRWHMYRLDRHNRPYRVVVPTEPVDASELSETSEPSPRTSLRYKTGRFPR